jgi:probable O-glycosylation ligase (exosortase A-associated)
LGSGKLCQNIGNAAAFFFWNNFFQPLWFARTPGMFNSGVFVFVVLLISVAVGFVKGNLKLRFNLFILFYLILLSWMVISTLSSPTPKFGWDGIAFHLTYHLPVLLIASVIHSKDDVQKIMTVIAISIGFYASKVGISCLKSGANQAVAFEGGQMSDNNYFMAAVVSMVPFFIYSIFHYDSYFPKIMRKVFIAISVLSVVAIVFSNSRGAAIGLAALILLYIVLVSKRKIRDVVIIGVLATITFFLLPKSFFERMSTIEVGVEQKEASASARMNLMQSAYKCALDHPVFGVGPECWIKGGHAWFYARDNHLPHCGYLKFAAELGFVGLFIYLIFVTYTILCLLFIRNRLEYDGDKKCAAFSNCISHVNYRVSFTERFSGWSFP